MKREIADLSILGGEPAFDRNLYVGCPNIGNRERLLDRINNALDRRWLSNNGPYVQEFEQRVASMLGVKHCIATCNGTIALEITIRALGLSGEVIIPAFTFIATAHALQWQELTPVFCDVDPQSHNIDACLVEEMITPRTTGIIGVHLWGRPCDIEILTNIAQKHRLTLLFDAAPAFGCSYKGCMIGSFGDAEVFSFHATKLLNSFEGGAVVTNDDELAARIRLMKNFGFRGCDDVICIGTNGKMNEISAAMGLTGLESLDEFVAVNYRNYKEYRRQLDDVPGLQFVTYDESEKHNYQYIVVEVDQAITGISRDLLVEILHAENVLARRYFYPGCHRMEPYRSCFPHAGLLLPETEKIAKRVLSLPTGTTVGLNAISDISQIIRMVVAQGKQVKEMLSCIHTKQQKKDRW